MELQSKTKIIELRAEGYSFSKIAKAVGCSKQTALDECKRNKEKLEAMRSVKWEETLEKYRLTKKQRLRAHANLLKRLGDEIERRPLTDIPTDKLIALYMKEDETIKNEFQELPYRSTDEQLQQRTEREILDGVIPTTPDAELFLK